MCYFWLKNNKKVAFVIFGTENKNNNTTSVHVTEASKSQIIY